MQSIFPSVTKFGMAALLPHEKLSAVYQGNKIQVLADGEFTGSDYREKILKSAREDSVQGFSECKAVRAQCMG